MKKSIDIKTNRKRTIINKPDIPQKEKYIKYIKPNKPSLKSSILFNFIVFILIITIAAISGLIIKEYNFFNFGSFYDNTLANIFPSSSPSKTTTNSPSPFITISPTSSPLNTPAPTPILTPTSTTSPTPEPATSKSISIAIYNGSGRAGEAGALAKKLRSTGYTRVTSANAASKRANTIIYYKPINKSAAEEIQKVISKPNAILQEKSIPQDIQIITGKN